MTELYDACAGPGFFGPWVIVASQINGPVTYGISATPLGKTIVVGQVRYWDVDDVLREDLFFDSTEIRTGNSTQSVRIRFKGLGLGSPVRVIVTSGFRSVASYPPSGYTRVG
jgi:hypothetical protein